MSRPTNQVFHLAVPCDDLAEAKAFYEQFPKCQIARTYEDRITLSFFGDQLVCHLAPDKVDTAPELYPRHFGITFFDEREWLDVLAFAEDSNIPFFMKPFNRFQGKREEHRTFVLRDPSNNLLEFKYYFDKDMAY